jgi:hypothetical protein
MRLYFALSHRCNAYHVHYASQDFLPYARTEMVIDSQEHRYRRRIVLRIPRDLSRQMMILVATNPHTCSGTYTCTGFMMQTSNLRLGYGR